jgi:hypothetical protein
MLALALEIERSQLCFLPPIDECATLAAMIAPIYMYLYHSLLYRWLEALVKGNMDF